MAKFEDFKKTAAETAGSVADKSMNFARKVADKTKCVARIASLRADIAGDNELMRKTYKELGKAYFEAHKDAPEEIFAQMCTDLTLAEERIAAAYAEIDSLKAQLKNNEIEVEFTECEDECCCDCCKEAEEAAEAVEEAAETVKEAVEEAAEKAEEACDCGCCCEEKTEE